MWRHAKKIRSVFLFSNYCLIQNPILSHSILSQLSKSQPSTKPIQQLNNGRRQRPAKRPAARQSRVRGRTERRAGAAFLCNGHGHLYRAGRLVARVCAAVSRRGTCNLHQLVHPPSQEPASHARRGQQEQTAATGFYCCPRQNRLNLLISHTHTHIHPTP